VDSGGAYQHDGTAGLAGQSHFRYCPGSGISNKSDDNIRRLTGDGVSRVAQSGVDRNIYEFAGCLALLGIVLSRCGPFEWK
jgi:hypothetical protein